MERDRIKSVSIENANGDKVTYRAGETPALIMALLSGKADEVDFTCTSVVEGDKTFLVSLFYRLLSTNQDVREAMLLAYNLFKRGENGTID